MKKQKSEREKLLDYMDKKAPPFKIEKITVTAAPRKISAAYTIDISDELYKWMEEDKEKELDEIGYFDEFH